MEFAIDNQLKAELKKKWLAYYKQNRIWIWANNINRRKIWQHQGSRYSRPNGDFIIPVIIALEPTLSSLMPCLSKFHNLEEIVTILGIDFDPDFTIAQEELEKVGIKGVETINVLPESQSVRRRRR